MLKNIPGRRKGAVGNDAHHIGGQVQPGSHQDGSAVHGDAVQHHPVPFAHALQQPDAPGTHIPPFPDAHGQVVPLALQAGLLIDDQQVKAHGVIFLENAAEVPLTAALKAVDQQHGTPGILLGQVLAVQAQMVIAFDEHVLPVLLGELFPLPQDDLAVRLHSRAFQSPNEPVGIIGPAAEEPVYQMGAKEEINCQQQKGYACRGPNQGCHGYRPMARPSRRGSAAPTMVPSGRMAQPLTLPMMRFQSS